MLAHSRRAPGLAAMRGPATCALLLLLAACGGEPEAGSGSPSPDWPEGTVLVVDGEGAITRQDVDSWLEAVAIAEPGRSKVALRRLSLTNIVLPLVVGQVLDSQARDEARQEAEAILADLQADRELQLNAPPLEDLVDGYWKYLGLDVWQLARHAPIGEWQLQESVGAYTLFRVEERDPEPWNHLSRAHVQRLLVPYLDEQISYEVISQGFDSLSLEILDDDWREIVPARYLSSMGVEPAYERELNDGPTGGH